MNAFLRLAAAFCTRPWDTLEEKGCEFAVGLWAETKAFSNTWLINGYYDMDWLAIDEVKK